MSPATADPAGRERRAGSRLAIGLLALTLAFLVACSGGEASPSSPDLALLPKLNPHAGPGRAGGAGRCREADGKELPAEPRQIELAGSTREAVVTCARRTYKMVAELPPHARLELSVARPVPAEPEGSAGGDPPEPALATAQAPEAAADLIVGGERRRVFARRLSPGGAWSDYRVDLGAFAPAAPGKRKPVQLVLSSTGDSPVAWSELYLTGERSPGEAAEPAGRPNLVLVSLDTLRADHLDLYGYERATSPNLDRLACDSLVFTQALSASTWTLPSTASMVTGLLPSQHGATSIHAPLAPRVLTLAERLAAAGYRTAAFTDGGFLDPRWGFAQGFERYDSTAGKAWQYKDAAPIFSAASDWLRANRFRPFFLFLQTYEIHEPYVNREGFADPFFDPHYAGPLGDVVRIDNEDEPPAPEDLLHVVALYDGGIARADHYLGAVLDTLARTGLDRDTAVIVTSDHGEEFLEHGRMEHTEGHVYDPNVRVPLVVRPPGGTAGRRVARTVSGLDVTPTLLACAGLPATGLAGRSLVTLASPDGADLPVLVHGIPSLLKVTGDRFRLDGTGGSVILERFPEHPEGRVLTYDPKVDRAAPRSEVSPAAEGLGRRLAAILAWLGHGRLMARLPDDTHRVEVPEDSRIQAVGVWDGLRWHPVPASGEGLDAIALDPGRPIFLIFDLRKGRGALGLRVTRADSGEAEPFWIHPRHGAASLAWDPFSDPLPGVGVAVATAASFQPGRTRVDRRARQELRALGYVD